MKTFITVFAFMFIYSSTCLAEKTISLPKVDFSSIAAKNKYLVDENGEINVRGKFIKRIEVASSSISITFHNKTNEDIKPMVSVYAYNPYGMLIGSIYINWVFSSISPGKIKTESEDMYIRDNVKIFKYTKLKTDKDFNKIMFIIVTSGII